MHYSLRQKVLLANKNLGKTKLVKLNWGNISQIDRSKNLIAIKPSGVNYNTLKINDIPVVDINGKIISGKLKPSTDLKTHLEIYKKIKDVNGICHTHSKYATIFCQSGKSIPCIGTTHADYFFGEIPITRYLSKNEVKYNYEENTGKIVVETYIKKKIKAKEVPAILVRGHAPFVLGSNAANALENSIVLEEVAEMYYKSFMLNKKIKFDKELINKHFKRKNGPKKYYGQQI
ncbi:L-ribulose-5-phosphate 4-epimerase AraD [Candidatus Pelagibacter sp.]|nr:L-ribulose-5-phosphate 4-epimerase AraD [Candidatus Pelagibacter sp.]